MDMRVATSYDVYSVYNAKNTSGAKKTEKSGASESRKDVFSLSTQAEDYQTVRKVLVNVPDVRADRISQVKAKLASGGYQASASNIAAKILQELED